jgi:hypothetical protein
MTDELSPSAEPTQPAPRWQALSPLERRVAGVLVEKAKTTPDAYPMTLNALRAGCNQKSNRDPVMNVQEEELQEALESLRSKGAASEVIGGGRVSKFRQHLYEWLAVNRQEMAVMCELLLRGPQTEGELRAHAARMEPGFKDLADLRPVLAALKQRNLVVPLTPEGRGHAVTHNLYPPEELAAVQAAYSRQASTTTAFHGSHAAASSAAAGSQRLPSPAQADEILALRRELAALREELQGQIQQLRDELACLNEGAPQSAP